MNGPARRVATTLIAVLAVVAAASPAAAQVSLTALGTPYAQSFDTLPASGSATWANNSTIPGWFHARTGTGTTIVANDGSSNAGNLYSYGTGTATDRALGSIGSGNAAVGNLFWGVRLQNNTGATITSLAVSYVGEQWRNSAAAAQSAAFSYLVGSPTVTGSLAEFQSAGTAVSQLTFTSPVTGGTAGALNGNLAANRTAISYTITGLSIPNGTEVMLRWSDPDHSGSDHGLSIDDFSVTPLGGPGPTTLTIDDVTHLEGNSGTTTYTFTVSLSSPAGAGGVTFDIATADGTAVAPGDYTANSVTGATIAAGNSTFTFDVLVNGDPTVEPDETFFVNVTNVSGATVGDGQGQGTITNDDVTLVAIHDIQGNGTASPLAGATVTTRGVVTGVKFNNGFFMQESDASVDADPNTSEGIFVFTSSAPPAIAAIGNYVQVTAVVSEFAPGRGSLTELTGPTVSLVSTPPAAPPMPAPVPLTTALPDPAGSWTQLERLEGMRVSVASFTVTAPTDGTTNEPNATGSSNGVVHGVVTGVTLPLREAGIQQPDLPPSGSIPPIPRWDSNPELLRVDTDGQVGATRLELSGGAILANLVGPLDYAFDRYSILPDAATPPGVTPGITATPVTAPFDSEFTVASYNLERFFDTTNDPAIGEPVLTATAFANRLQKASLQIRNYLRMPDILGVVEVENLATLQALATQINTDAGAPSPQYVAYLVEGNDPGGIDVGFLVKTAPRTATEPWVTVTSVTQVGQATTYINPNTNGAEMLNDRPPLVLEAIVHHPNGVSADYPVTVIVNHLRSYSGVDDPTPAGTGTEGARVRAKRLAQAQYLANLVQARQTANPAERIVLVGDFNAFDVNDGYGDLMSTIAGTAFADATTVVPGDGTSLVTPPLVNLIGTSPAAEHYSFVFDGTRQSLDHVLANAPFVAGTLARRLEHARVSADFPETDRSVYGPTAATRLSDHDPLVAYFQVAAFATADLSITAVDAPDPVPAGASLAYAITVTNAGPDAAAAATWSDTLPAGTTFVSLPAFAGWSCTTPAVGAPGTVSCSNPSFAVGSAAFTLTVAVGPGLAAGTVLSNTATVTSATADPVAANNSATATTTVSAAAALLSATKTATGSLVPGSLVTYTIVVRNTGSSVQADNPGNELVDVLPASLILVSATASSGTAVATVGTNTVTWNGSISAGGTVTITVSATIGNGVVAGTAISNQATVSYDLNGDGANESTGVSDNPATPAPNDPTGVVVLAANAAVIPVLDGLGLGILALLVALGGALVVGRRLS